MRRFVIAALVVASSSSFADPPRYAREQPVVVPVKLSDRVKPKEPAKVEAATPISADAVLVIKDRQQPLRREQERILEKLIKDTPADDPDKPEYMFRLAEHYAQQLQFWRIKAVEEQLGK